MKYTAQAPANIALIKYWGKQDEALRIPLNDSISMNLSGAYTTTTVEFSTTYPHDSIELLDGVFSESEQGRIRTHLDRIRRQAKMKTFARIVTKNSFPKGTGIASSASGFAALTIAASNAAGLKLSEKELTILARLGSGSACRSIPDGFVEWKKGPPSGGSDESYAHTLYPSSYWDLCDILLVLESKAKEISSSRGMQMVDTSPLLTARLADIPQRIARLKIAFEYKDFEKLGQAIEEDCLDMHAVMKTQKPSLVYLSSATNKVIEEVRQWRDQGIAVYFTIDAGPNVHVICEEKNKKVVLRNAQTLTGIQQVIVNTVGKGARIIEEHLF